MNTMNTNTSWIEKHDPIQERAAERWEQGLPLGNGKIGAMVWGGCASRPLTVSLDQAEIWDLRAWTPSPDKTWTEYKALLVQDRGDEVAGFAYGPEDVHTMRVPVGRVEVIPEGAVLKHASRLRLYSARCEGTLTTDRDRAYPLMKLAVKPLLSELEAGEDGFLHLPWTSSPEYHGVNETLRWIKKEAPDWKRRFGPDATIDLALLRWLLHALREASALLNVDEAERESWRETLDRLAPYARDALGGLAVRRDVNLITTHRHMSHLFPIYPLGEWTMADHAEDIKRCLDVLGTLGHGEWMGWSFPWAALIYGRAGRPACSRNLLLDFIDRYVTETGVPYQGPQGMCDVSLYGDGGGNWGQTIEAQLGLPEAVHELLVRTERGVTRVFRDCPPAWAECGFEGLRCEGAFLLTAMRNDYRTTFVRVASEAGGRIAIDTDLGEGELHGPVRQEGGLYVADMAPGETLTFWRGEAPEAAFEPLPGNPTEINYWGVKRVRRF